VYYRDLYWGKKKARNLIGEKDIVSAQQANIIRKRPPGSENTDGMEYNRGEWGGIKRRKASRRKMADIDRKLVAPGR
jgi:hypothetical protein